MSEELKPCPFCGDKDQGVCENEDGYPVIQCCNCGAYGPCIKLTLDEARAEWNRRASQVTEGKPREGM